MVAAAIAIAQILRPPQPFMGFDFLAKGDIVEVRVETRACFAHLIDSFRFEQGDRLTVRVTGDSSLGSRGGNLNTPWSEYRREVTAEEVKGLTSYVLFLQERRKGGCTTAVFIDLRHWRNGLLFAEEHLIDQTCRVDNLRVDARRVRDLKIRPELNFVIPFYALTE